jgi:GNAT superfamily N-acetyltransferase
VGSGNVDIREAEPADWPAIWPFFREIVQAGETYAYDRDMSEEDARRLWMLVDAAASGRGAGRALGEDVIAWAERSGFRAIQFNAVVETNERAVALWRSLGFEIVGTVPDAFHHPERGYVGLHVMHRRL